VITCIRLMSCISWMSCRVSMSGRDGFGVRLREQLWSGELGVGVWSRWRSWCEELHNLIQSMVGYPVVELAEQPGCWRQGRFAVEDGGLTWAEPELRWPRLDLELEQHLWLSLQYWVMEVLDRRLNVLEVKTSTSTAQYWRLIVKLIRRVVELWKVDILMTNLRVRRGLNRGKQVMWCIEPRDMNGAGFWVRHDLWRTIRQGAISGPQNEAHHKKVEIWKNPPV